MAFLLERSAQAAGDEDSFSGDPASVVGGDKDDRLGDRTPLSMLNTEAGGREIESMLWGIDEGVYS